MRRMYVAGNWKMNLSLADATALLDGIAGKMPKDAAIDVGVFPSFAFLAPLADKANAAGILFGGQNCYDEPKGAFTGEVSISMLKDVGCNSVIIGHSERRHVFGETGAMLKKKVVAALAGGLKVIYCIGETLAEREAGRTEAVLHEQIHDVLGADVSLDNVVIAYEPVWAIGTGVTASPDQAQEAHAFTRKEIASLYNDQVAEALRIQYGGSVKPDNAKELMSQPDVDGALVGGASLKVDDFVGIIEGALAAQA